MKRISLLLLALAIGAVSLTGCLKKDYDTPPDQQNYDPNLTVTTTIQDLLLMNGSYNNAQKDDTQRITSDIVISGVVTANDKSGNFYKAIVIQDSTAAVQILINDYSLYARYPVGRKVYIKCQGLWLGYDGGTPVIGGGVNPQRGIIALTGAEIDRAIVNGPVNQPVMPDTVNLADIATFNATYLNRLVYIREAQFQTPGVSYAEPITTTNLYVEDCGSKKLVVRTSNYADFAPYATPAGKGPLMGIYTVYINASGSSKTPQLIVRDTSDLMLHGPRCGAPQGGTSLLSQNFEGVNTTGNLVIQGWKNLPEAGGVYWAGGSFSNNKFAKVSAFNSGQAVVRSWLVAPPVNLTAVTNPKLQFQTLDGFNNGATLKVLVSTDYNGGNTPWTGATWTEVPATIASGTTSGYAPNFTNSGEIDLSSYLGNSNVYVAFLYSGTSSQTTTYELDNVYITAD